MFQSIFIYSIIIPLFYFLARLNIKSIVGYKGESSHTKVLPFITVPTFFILLLFSIFCGIRYDVGADHLDYLEEYLNFNTLEEDLWGDYEPGYMYIMKTFYTLGLSPMLFFGFMAFLQILFFLLAFKNELYLWPWLLLFFFVNGGFMCWMNGIRQSLALCVWLYSIKYIEEKKIILYFVYCTIACMFHLSAIELCILYPFLRNGKAYFFNISFQFIIIIISFIIRIGLNQYFVYIAQFFVYATGGAYSNYLERLDSFSATFNTNIVFWYRIFVYCIIITYSQKLRRFYNSCRFNNIYTLFFIGIVSLCVIPNDMAILSRPFLYFAFFDSIMFAFFVFYLYKMPTKMNHLLMLLMIISFIGVFFGNQIVSNENSSVWYQFYFNQPTTQL